MPRPILIRNYEREIQKKIDILRKKLMQTPYESIKEAIWKEIENLRKELEELQK